MQADLRIELPPANFKVEQIIKNRSHLYQVTHDDKTTETYPGVTGFLGIISKPALIPWATRTALENAERALRALLGKSKSKKVVLTDAFIKGIIEEAKKQPEKLKDAAADLGTQAHAYFDAFIRGEAQNIEELPAAIQPAAMMFNEWYLNSGLRIVAGDTKVASRKYGYGGALDFLAVVEDENKVPAVLGLHQGDYILGDFKTSSGIWDEYALQVSAYLQAFLETYGVECRGAIIARFDKEQKKDKKTGELMPIGFEHKWLTNPKCSLLGFLDAKSLKERLNDEHYLEETVG